MSKLYCDSALFCIFYDVYANVMSECRISFFKLYYLFFSEVVGNVDSVEGVKEVGREGNKFDIKRFTVGGDGAKHIQCIVWGMKEIRRFQDMLEEGNVSMIFNVIFT